MLLFVTSSIHLNIRISLSLPQWHYPPATRFSSLGILAPFSTSAPLSPPHLICRHAFYFLAQLSLWDSRFPVCSTCARSVCPHFIISPCHHASQSSSLFLDWFMAQLLGSLSQAKDTITLYSLLLAPIGDNTTSNLLILEHVTWKNLNLTNISICIF